MTMTNRAWAELILLSLIWGASFLAIAVALRGLGPFTAVLYRVTIGAAILWAVVLIGRHALPRAPGFWAACLAMGVLNNVIPFSLLTIAQTGVESGLVAILNATTAFFGAVVAAAILPDERLTLRRVAGVGLGVAGVAAVMGRDALSGLDLRSLLQLACLGAALSYAFASVWARLRLSGAPPVVAAAGMLTGSTLVMAPLAVTVEGAPRLDLAAEVWLAVAYYAAVGTAGAYLLYYRVLKMAGAANLMLCTILISPIAVFLGWAVLGERLAPSALAGFVLIASGMLVLDGRVLRWVARRPGAA